MNEMNLAAQMYSVREFQKTPEDILASLKKISAMGYKVIQASGMGPIEPELFKQYTDELGLNVFSTHLSYERLKDDFDAVMKEHKLWGAKYIGLGAMPTQFRGSREGYLTFAGECNEISKRIYDLGFKFIYHNHKFEFEKFNGTLGMDLLLDNTDPETFGFEIDTYWVQAGGGNPVEWIKKVEGRMEVVHFKDMAILENEQIFAEIGEGNLNWSRIIDACRETNVEWYCVEQDKSLRDPFESLQMSLNYLKKYFK